MGAPGLLTYLQFKLSDHMIGPTAAERSYFMPGGEYYRFHIRNENTASGKNTTRIANRTRQPPRQRGVLHWRAFFLRDDLRDCYKAGTVIGHSIMFSPKMLGSVDPSQSHVVAFLDSNADFGWVCSEPESRVEGIPGNRLPRHLSGKLSDARPITIEHLRGSQDLSTPYWGTKVAQNNACRTIAASARRRRKWNLAIDSPDCLNCSVRPRLHSGNCLRVTKEPRTRGLATICR